MADEKSKVDNAGSENKAKAEGKSKKKSGSSKKKSGATNDVRIAGSGETTVSGKFQPNLMKLYKETVAPSLVKEFQITNPMLVPRLKKVVINCGVKEAVGNPKVLDNTLNDIMAIAGQKPVMTRARKAIANFKVRQGIPLGVRVTLRRARMYEFLDRLMNVTLPRVRDFKGVNPKAFDGRGNYSLGIKEQIIFPEIDYDKVDSIRGLTVTIETTTQKNEEARALLAGLGMPFKK